MTHRVSTVKAELLQALEALGGYATKDQLTVKTGYATYWASKKLLELYEEGTLQRSKLNPALYSLPGKPLAPKVNFTADKKGARDMVKYLTHLHGLEYKNLKTLRDNLKRSNTTGIQTLLQLAELAGYEIILTPKEGNT